jgi:hypothetical protein
MPAYSGSIINNPVQCLTKIVSSNQWKKISILDMFSSIGCQRVAVAAQRSSQPALRNFAIWSGKSHQTILMKVGLSRFVLNFHDT